AGCEDGGVLQVVPEAGVRKRVLVGWRDSGVRGPRQFMTISIRVCVLLATACAPGLFSAGFTMRVTEKNYLDTQGFSVFLYDSTYHPVFIDQKNTAMEMILHGRRIATN